MSNPVFEHRASRVIVCFLSFGLLLPGACSSGSDQNAFSQRDASPTQPRAQRNESEEPQEASADAGERYDAGSGDAGPAVNNAQDRDQMFAAEDAGQSNQHVEICDGSDRVRFAYLSTPPGSPLRGTWILHWFPLFYVTGKCELHIAGDGWHELRAKHLSSAELATLEDELSVSGWSELSEKYCSSQQDGPGSVFYLAGKRAAVQACVGLYPRPPDWLVNVQVPELILKWYDQASDIETPVWYTLVRSDFPDALGPAFRGATKWTHGDPKQLGSNDVRKEPPLQRADGQMADDLRRLRDLWLEEEIGYRSAGFIPVLAADDVRFELRIRAITPLDDDAGTPQLPHAP